MALVHCCLFLVTQPSGDNLLVFSGKILPALVILLFHCFFFVWK